MAIVAMAASLLGCRGFRVAVCWLSSGFVVVSSWHHYGLCLCVVSGCGFVLAVIVAVASSCMALSSGRGFVLAAVVAFAFAFSILMLFVLFLFDKHRSWTKRHPGMYFG